MLEGRQPADEKGLQALAAFMGIESGDSAEVQQKVLGLLFCHCMYTGTTPPPRLASRELGAKLEVDILHCSKQGGICKPPLEGRSWPCREPISQVSIEGPPWW